MKGFRTALTPTTALVALSLLSGCDSDDLIDPPISPDGRDALIVKNDVDCPNGGTLIGETDEKICHGDATTAAPDPFVSTLRASTPFIYENEPATLLVELEEAAGFTYSYRWASSERFLEATERTITIAPEDLGNGTIKVTVTRTDGTDTEVQALAINLQIRSANIISTSNNQIFLPDDATPYTVDSLIDGTLIFSDLSQSGIDARELSGLLLQEALPGTTASIESINNIHKRIFDANSDFMLSNISTAQDADTGSTSSQYILNTGTDYTPTELINALLSYISTQTLSTADLPTPLSDEAFNTQFRYTITAQPNAAGTDLYTFIITVVAEENSDQYRQLANNITSFENIQATNVTLTSETQQFTASSTEFHNADFLFVIDNSASMREEQAAIRSAAEAFISEINSSNLDYRMGVITTDSAELRGSGFTDDIGAFKADIEPGTRGNLVERAVNMAEEALQSQLLGDLVDGSVTLAGYPREQSSLSIIIMSDEENQYVGEFKPTDNLFIDRNYTVYSIINPFKKISGIISLLSLIGIMFSDKHDLLAFFHFGAMIVWLCSYLHSKGYCFILGVPLAMFSLLSVVVIAFYPNKRTNGYCEETLVNNLQETKTGIALIMVFSSMLATGIYKYHVEGDQSISSIVICLLFLFVIIAGINDLSEKLSIYRSDKLAVAIANHLRHDIESVKEKNIHYSVITVHNESGPQHSFGTSDLEHAIHALAESNHEYAKYIYLITENGENLYLSSKKPYSPNSDVLT